MLYRVHINMEKIIREMDRNGIKIHNTKDTMVFVNAKDPDEACKIAIDKVCTDIVTERKTTNIQDMVKKLRKVVSVRKVRSGN